jgi:Rho termination factor, N-terminal domain
MTTITNQHARRGAQRAVRGLIVESAYATVGLGGAAVELARSIDRLRMEVPGQVRQLVDQGVATGRSLPDLAGREFEGLARRGRDLVGAIRTSNATQEAVHRTRTARSRVKAAGTSVGRAAEGAVEAAEQAAGIVAVGTAPTEERQVRVQPPKAQRPATSRRSRPATTKSASVRPWQAKPKAPAPAPVDGQTPTGPYEERTVEELQGQAAKLEIQGRSSMTKDELIKALRDKR